MVVDVLLILRESHLWHRLVMTHQLETAENLRRCVLCIDGFDLEEVAGWVLAPGDGGALAIASHFDNALRFIHAVPPILCALSGFWAVPPPTPVRVHRHDILEIVAGPCVG